MEGNSVNKCVENAQVDYKSAIIKNLRYLKEHAWLKVKSSEKKQRLTWNMISSLMSDILTGKRLCELRRDIKFPKSLKKQERLFAASEEAIKKVKSEDYANVF